MQPCQRLNLRCANWSVDASKCSSKTTHRFMKSDVSFYEKWRVVLREMTCCFMRNDVLFVQDNILVVQFYDFALSRARALFFISSRRSPLRGRLTTKHLPNNGIKSVPDLMSDWGLSRPSTLCSRTWHRLFIPATEVSQTLLSTFWLEWLLMLSTIQNFYQYGVWDGGRSRGEAAHTFLKYTCVKQWNFDLKLGRKNRCVL